MAPDYRTQLRDLGYLNSPVVHWIWGQALPGWRSHMRHLLAAGAALGLIMGTMSALVCTAGGTDLFKISVVYALATLIITLVMDIFVAVSLSSTMLIDLIRSGPFLSYLRLPIAILVFIMISIWLRSNLYQASALSRLTYLGVFALAALTWAEAFHLLIISRLYWFGHRPPKHKRHKFWMWLMACIVLGTYYFWPSPVKSFGAIADGPPLIVLGFDMPSEQMEGFANLLPSWPRTEFKADESDISQFWTRFGTGIRNQMTSLISHEIVGFNHALNQHDAILAPVIWFASKVGLSKPTTRTTRQTKYVWEILDEQGLKTNIFGFWHTFPASSQSGRVLSERWDLQHQKYPYCTGIPAVSIQENWLEEGSEDVLAVVQREQAIWHYLTTLGDEFNLTLAYFPLSDVLANQPEMPHLAIDDLPKKRAKLIHAWLSQMPEDSLIYILLTSGRSELDEGYVECLGIQSPNLRERFKPQSTETDFAKIALELHGLPLDKQMITALSNPTQEAVSYGPRSQWGPRHENDDAYLEQLRSLGYVK